MLKFVYIDFWGGVGGWEGAEVRLNYLARAIGIYLGWSQ